MGFVTRADVLADQHLIANEILEDHADTFAERALIPLLQIEPIEQDAPARRRIQPREQLDERGLAGAVFADQREARSRFQMKAHIFQRSLG